MLSTSYEPWPLAFTVRSYWSVTDDMLMKAKPPAASDVASV
jgi:hypothetical protein